MSTARKNQSTPAKWRVVSTDAKARTVVMQRGSETATFEMGSMRRVQGSAQ